MNSNRTEGFFNNLDVLLIEAKKWELFINWKLSFSLNNEGRIEMDSDNFSPQPIYPTMFKKMQPNIHNMGTIPIENLGAFNNIHNVVGIIVNSPAFVPFQDRCEMSIEGMTYFHFLHIFFILFSVFRSFLNFEVRNVLWSGKWIRHEQGKGKKKLI